MRGRPIDVRKSAVLLIAAVVLTGCNDIDAAAPAPSKGSPEGTPSKAPATPRPSPTHRKLKPGAKGADVKALQRRLKELHYDPGKADGKYGPSTETAVWAFQAVNRLKQKSTLTASFWKALDAPKEPRPMAKKREKNRVDVDLKRQYLVLYKNGAPRLITHVSSGSGEYYCAKDRGATVARCRYATTSTGDFRTGRRASGWETSPLGQLYNPIYFNGGIAFHGALDVPKYPASHGCVRMPMHIAEYFPDLVGTGVPVHVRRPG
ncbi:L,D-transpeptidase family protein [Actinomadura sp. NPDC000600]|uniref:L,D-transpeptidase family protein n=1 Tax=Actinomadura sp. NPDC000600 TaxID=3154262 RepID=UPI003393F2F2